MLTVKQKLASGHEYVFETRRVSYQPAISDPNDGSITSPETVFIERDDGSVAPFVGGWFYVMNDAGNTVSRYFIEEKIDPGTKAA